MLFVQARSPVRRLDISDLMAITAYGRSIRMHRCYHAGRARNQHAGWSGPYLQPLVEHKVEPQTFVQEIVLLGR